MTLDNSRAEKFAGEIGRLLRDRRKELGLTQAQLAGRIGVSQQQIVKYEKGIGRIPAEKLSSLAEWLKIDTGAIFYPLAVLDGASHDGAGRDGVGHDGASHDGFAESGASYQAETTTADREVSQLLRDFQKIDDVASRRAVLDVVSALAAKSGSRVQKRR